MKQLSVLVPVYNEAPILPELFLRLHKSLTQAKIAYEVIAIDDHSSDGSLAILKKLTKKYPLKVFSKAGQRGKAYSIIEAAQKAEAEIVCMIDSDLQYPPEAIPEMWKMTRDYGVVVAKRKTYDGSLLRRVGSRVLAFSLGKILLGINTDVQSGLKVFRKEFLSYLPEKELSPWSLDMPLLHTALEMGYRLGEISIVFEKRAFGKSKLSLLKPTVQIAQSAIRLKFRTKQPEAIKPANGSMLGAGVIHKRNRFITHTTLHPRQSALSTFTTSQKSFFLSIFALVIIGFIFNALTTAIVLVGILSFVYFVDVMFNFYLIIKSLHSPPELKASSEEIESLRDAELPVYSVLCPLYKEAHIIPGFLSAIEAMEWPKNKLDVMLLFEADDDESIEAVKHLRLPKYVRVIVVPDSQPKTKPKACNYGLGYAQGEYVVIYDAEDIPDPLQLKKAYLAFNKVGPDIKCLQAKLNYYNPQQNWLTRFFTAEYSLWFDVILTGLQSIQTTIPLGGTSNHFRRQDLIDLEGWDPFNVTEDCDLGIRLFKRGYKTAIIDSTTMEEANSNVKNWLRQRSRWIKGYMQTYLIHMRNPLDFATSQGIHALLFQLTVGGKLAFILINPILWLLTISYFTLYSFVGPTIESVYPSIVFYMAVTSLIFGNFLYLYYYMIGLAKREQWGLIKWVFLIPVYWLMVSVAGAIALYQLIVKPHYWEKTVHGLHLKKALEKQAKVVAKEVIAEVAAHAGEKMLINEPAPFSPNLQHQSRFEKINSKLKFLSLKKTLLMIKNPQYLSGSIFIVATLIANLLNMATNFYLGKTLSFENFGIFNIVVSLLYLISIPVNALGGTVSYKTSFLLGKHQLHSATHFWRYLRKKILPIVVLISLVWLGLSFFLPRVFNLSEPWPFVSLTILWGVSLVLAVDGGYLNGRLKFASLAVITVAQPLTRLISSVVLAQTRPHIVYLSIIIGMLVAGAVASWSARQGKDTLTDPREFHLPKSFYMASLVAGLSTIAFFSLDNLLIAHLMNPYEVGRYSVLGLFGKMIFFVGSLTSVFLAPIVARYEGAGKNSNRIFIYTLLSVIATTTLGYSFFAIGISVFGANFFGEKVSTIKEFLPLYGLAIAFFTVAQVFVSYHLLKKDYLFPSVALLLSVVEIMALISFHQSLSQVVWVMFAVAVAHLATFTTLHMFYKRINIPLKNVQDLLGLFGKLPKKTMESQTPSNYRILIFNWRDTKHVWAGGAEVYVHEIAKCLVAQGHKVTVFCGNDGHAARNEVIDGVQMVRRGGFYTVYFWACLYYVSRFRGLFDAVIDCENGIPFLTPLYVRKPLTLVIHHVHQEVFRSQLKWPLSWIAIFIEGTIMPHIYKDRPIITVSESTKLEIQKLYKHNHQEITVIHPGVTFSPLKMKKTEYPSVCYVGRLKPYKNVDVAIKAFALVAAVMPSAKMAIAGSGESESSLKKLVKQLELEDKVSFLGKISETEKQQLYASRWVAIQPSMVEGWGITVIEANVQSTPVVASDVKGLRDSVRHKETGLLIEAGNVQAFASGLTLLLTQRSLRKKLSDNAKKWAQLFEWKKSAAIFEQVLISTILLKRQKISYTASVESLSARPIGNE